MYYSQHGEDNYLESLFLEKTNGVCIEVGAYDGISMSNTLFFEKLGWKCLCIEPIDSAYEKCKQIRKEVIQCCVSSKDDTDKEFIIFHLHTNLSAISSLEPDERLIQSHTHLITDRTTQMVKVRSLTSILDELNYPTNIDFVSIDTENNELDVLKGIDFSKYNIKVLLIENNFNEPFCEDYLKSFGYRKIHRLKVNDFYVKDSV
jgi:FkbM family methyltransferase